MTREEQILELSNKYGYALRNPGDDKQVFWDPRTGKATACDLISGREITPDKVYTSARYADNAASYLDDVMSVISAEESEAMGLPAKQREPEPEPEQENPYADLDREARTRSIAEMQEIGGLNAVFVTDTSHTKEVVCYSKRTGRYYAWNRDEERFIPSEEAVTSIGLVPYNAADIILHPERLTKIRPCGVVRPEGVHEGREIW